MSKDPIPSFFRMLIIDDTIAAETATSQQYKEFFRNTFTALVLEAAKEKEHHLDHISIVFEGDPAVGFNKWQDEPFDVTLIDADFSANLIEGEIKNLSKYALTSKDQGFNILHLLDTFVATGKYAYRKDGCGFFLWSGHGETTVNDNFSRLKGIDKAKYFIPKKIELSDFLSQIRLDELLNKIINHSFTIEHKIERLCFAYNNDIGDITKKLSGGCIIHDKDDQFPFFKKIKDSDFIVCPTRIPDSVLESDIPFIPLDAKNLVEEGIIFVQSVATDAVKKNNYATPLCNILKKRAGLFRTGKSTPYYQQEDIYKELAPNQQKAIILGYHVKNHFVAAVTPLTSTTVIGHDDAITSLQEKTIALLNGPFGAIILKTVYLDSMGQWKGVNWPALQVQSHNRTRCLLPNTGTSTIWHTGRTALEMLQPKQLNFLLRRLETILKEDTHRVIVSLGSKFRPDDKREKQWRPDQKKAFCQIWVKLFEEIFKSIGSDKFPIIEVNVRHFIREIVIKWLGGDEYLTPHNITVDSLGGERRFWQEFDIWICALHETAVKFKKKLILKLPHRSDTLAFVQAIIELRREHLSVAEERDKELGVRAITLVNALKTPVPYSKKVSQSSKAWYAHPWAWKDAAGKTFKYQMSGSYLAPYRNQLLAGVIESFKDFENIGMEILISGGITSKADIEYLNDIKDEGKVLTGLQIGAWALLETKLKSKKWDLVKAPKYLGKKNNQDPELIIEPIVNSITPRIAFCNISKCNKCGECHKSFYCDSFLDRINVEKDGCGPIMDSRNCSGCGLCVQRCMHGALHLYRMDETLVLISSSKERRDILDTIPIPFLFYDPIEDLKKFSQIFKSNLLKKIEDACCNGCASAEALRDIIQQIWEIRIDDVFFLGKNREDLYPDNRKKNGVSSQKECKKSCFSLIKKLEEETITEAEKRTITRAVIWSQLIWSDPGQVLWNSHILTLQTVLKDTETKICMNFSGGDDASLQIEAMKNKLWEISSYAVLMRQGEIIFDGWINSRPFQLNELNIDYLKKYNRAGMGKGRFGLDVRACGDFLIKNFSDIEGKDRQAMAGLPWDLLRDKIQKKHEDAFETLCKAVSKRG